MPKQVLLPLNPFPDTMLASELQALVGAVAMVGGDADAIINSARIPPVSSALGGLVLDVPGLIGETEERCARHAAEIKSELKQSAEARNLVISFGRTGAFPGDFPAMATLAARYRDLSIVLLRQSDTGSRQLAEALIFGAGRPVLIIPGEIERSSIRVFAVAWDGSRVASRALADAMSLFPAAEVRVFTVADEKRLPQADIGDHLTKLLMRAGRTATHVQLKVEGRPIADVLQEATQTCGAGMLVMGGFGHSRLRDFVLGGATAGVLAGLKVPVLLSH
ncbi:MAG: universal stress protein [Rhizobiaceae bacterium]|nr:universal stress protein [Rhizobiaceae bacterium]